MVLFNQAACPEESLPDVYRTPRQTSKGRDGGDYYTNNDCHTPTGTMERDQSCRDRGKVTSTSTHGTHAPLSGGTTTEHPLSCAGPPDTGGGDSAEYGGAVRPCQLCREELERRAMAPAAVYYYNQTVH